MYHQILLLDVLMQKHMYCLTFEKLFCCLYFSVVYVLVILHIKMLFTDVLKTYVFLFYIFKMLFWEGIHRLQQTVKSIHDIRKVKASEVGGKVRIECVNIYFAA